jgi:beta-fructofuranosidase
LRSNDSCGLLPPNECDLQLPFIESQCAVRPVDPSDPKLTHWTKVRHPPCQRASADTCFFFCLPEPALLAALEQVEYPWLALPPPDMGLGGWRDPYIICRPGQGGHDQWSLLIGSGIKDNGGTVLVYTSQDILEGVGTLG